MTARTASCNCGALTATVSGEPFRNSICHCLNCKRRTGSAFAWTAHWPASQVETSGDAAIAVRSSDEGFWCRERFCPVCSVTVWYEIERRPGAISIPVGAFADPDFPAPTVEVYEERRCAWLGKLASDSE